MDGLIIGWPEGIYLALTAAGLIVKSHDRAPSDFATTLVALGLTQVLLWWGGFYS